MCSDEKNFTASLPLFQMFNLCLFHTFHFYAWERIFDYAKVHFAQLSAAHQCMVKQLRCSELITLTWHPGMLSQHTIQASRTSPFRYYVFPAVVVRQVDWKFFTSPKARWPGPFKLIFKFWYWCRRSSKSTSITTWGPHDLARLLRIQCQCGIPGNTFHVICFIYLSH